VSSRIGLREWLAHAEFHSTRTAAATFDTRVVTPRLAGSAARGAQKRLGKLGVRVIVPAKNFYVTGTTGPLVDGEQHRAHQWGRELASRLTAEAASTDRANDEPPG
jgi:hypothetical protein